MPTYKITDKMTGKIIKITGDSPPTEQEVSNIFSSLKTTTAKQPEVPEWGREYPTLYGIAGAAYETAKPFVEAAGLIGGGVIGTPLGLAGQVAGTALGFAGAKRLTGMAGQALGVQKPETVETAFRHTAKDVLSGAQTAMEGPILGKGIEIVGKKVLAPFAEKIGEQGKNILTKIKQAKIIGEEVPELTAAEITQSKPLSLMENMLNYIPGSSGKIQDFRLGQIKSLMNMRDKLIEKTSSGEGSPQSLERVGLTLKGKIDDFIVARGITKEAEKIAARNVILKKMGSSETYEMLGMKTQETINAISKVRFEKASQLYGEIGKDIPKGTKIATPKLQQKATELLNKEMGVAPSLQDKQAIAVLRDLSGQTDDILKQIQSYPPNIQKQLLEQSGKKLTWEELQTTRSKLGELIRGQDIGLRMQQPGMKFLSSKEGGLFKQLKGALDADIEQFSTQTGGKIKESMDIANVFYREGKQLYKNQDILRISKANPERIVDMIFRPGRVTEINMVKKAIGEQNFEPLKQKFVSKIFDKASQGGFTWQGIQKELTKYGDETISNIFKPEEIKTFTAVINKGIKGESLPIANKFMVDFIRKSDPRTVMNIIFHPQNSQNIRRVKAVIGNDTFNQARTLFTEDLLKMNEIGLYRAKVAARQFSKFDEKTLNAIYKPEELKFLKDIVDFSNMAQGAEVIAGNPSGTGQAIITFQSGKAVLRDPRAGAWYWILPKALAKMYLSPTARQWFTTGFKLPGGTRQATEIATKLLSVYGKDMQEIKGQPNDDTNQ